ncbi:MAG TPA: enoyl-CoA hydratase/isomerase family protein [Iamia sp.]|jgi:enoyl-CoA hydratase/carnithine racemase|nr:enoyl-CoA hydratase/isomerase family protein [Iamia sp.]
MADAAPLTLDRDGEVFVLRMDDGENRFSPTMLDAFAAALDEVEGTEGPRALVTTGTGKYWSNGLDLDWISADPDGMVAYVGRVQALMARVLALPCVTVAAGNGHTFAAGAMLSLCHDIRTLRADRGWWCLPEVDLGMPFTPGMNALIPARLPAVTAHEAMVTGRRYTGGEALAAGIVSALADEDGVVPEAVALAAPLATKAGPGLARIRTTLHADVIALLLDTGTDAAV